MQTFKKICFVLVWVLVVALIVGIILYFSKMTNGFQEDFKTFYLSYGDSNITARESKVSLEYDSENRFEVNYTVGFTLADNADNTYSVKVIPNSAYKDLKYTVDGEQYLYGDLDDLSDVFKVKRTEEYFTISTPNFVDLQSVLSAKYPDQKVEVSDEYAKANNYYYTLRVANYSESIVYNINFNFGIVLNITPGDIEF